MKEINYYKTDDGKCYIEEFFDTLTDEVMQKIAYVLRLIRELEIVPKKFFKKLTGTDGIWECRIQYKSNIYRLFCFFEKGNLVILTHGIIKKSQKTPSKEIKLAEEYKNDYLRRRNKNG